LNYRHAFHAGNFADVLKHAVLARVLVHLAAKETPFRVIETHAGAGRYDLAGDEASRSGEWREGIGKIFERPPGGEAGALLQPYLAVVRAENFAGGLNIYPGSPVLARALLRPQDRMTFCELQPREHALLAASIKGDRRAQAIEIDGWTALRAHVPPPERRGLVLIDPSFEEPGEFERLAAGLAEAHRRWATGIYLLWYPIKNPRGTEAFARRMARLGIAKILRIELTIGSLRPDDPLAGCGLLVVNPPWTLEREMTLILPELARALGRERAGRQRLDWIARMS
jgi:23S rRNA (adenine2030-N6)-methyltransferase